MQDGSSNRSRLGRREFLTSGGAAVTALTAAAFAAEASAVPWGVQDWQAASEIPLWNGPAPNGGYQAQPLPADTPPFFLRNIERPFLRVFRPARPNARMLLSIPGGSYGMVSIGNEGVSIARDMAGRGYTVFVLAYRLPGEGWAGRADVPLQDAQRAVRLMRARAAQFACDPDQVYVVGFSAGGHLAATLATGYAEPVYEPGDAADGLSARPRAAGLIYPVISQTDGIGHAGSRRNLLGPEPAMADVARRSPERLVGAETPPAFLLHAMDDNVVPVENSLLMMGAFRAARRPVEAHFFESGGHGFGAGKTDQPDGAWLRLFAKWIDSHAG